MSIVIFVAVSVASAWVSLRWLINRSRPKASYTNENKYNAEVVYGVLGNYAQENDPNDVCYGLYIQLGQHTVFIDIRKDKYLKQREAKALELYENRTEIQSSLEAFILANPLYLQRSINCIGLHSKNLNQGEVFWNPNGYTLLKGLSFVCD